MEEIFLDVEPRQELGKGGVKDLRRKGFVPAVVYSQEESLPIKVSHKELMRLIHQHRLESVVINLRIKDDKKHKSRACLIKETQYDPVRGDVMHIDFNQVSLTKAIKVNVPLVAKGEPIGIKQEGGSLEHVLWEIEVECLPTNIPKEIEVDVSQLKLGDAIHIKDITFPANVKVLNDPATIVLSIAAPMKEEVIVEVAQGQKEEQEPEVIKEKKEIPTEALEEERKEDKEKK